MGVLRGAVAFMTQFSAVSKDLIIPIGGISMIDRTYRCFNTERDDLRGFERTCRFDRVWVRKDVPGIWTFGMFGMLGMRKRKEVIILGFAAAWDTLEKKFFSKTS